MNSDEPAVVESVRKALQPDYDATMHKIVAQVGARMSGHPADEVYDAIVDEAIADLPDFEPDRDALTALAVRIQNGTPAD